MIDINERSKSAVHADHESIVGNILKGKKLSRMSPTEYLKTVTELRKRLNGIRRDLVVDRTPSRTSAFVCKIRNSSNELPSEVEVTRCRRGEQ